MTDLTVDVISDFRDFAACQDEWNRLADESGVRHPFVSHAWLSTWWECFGEGKDLRIFIVKSGGEWVAAAPMMVHRMKMYGVPVRRLDSIYNYHFPRYEFLMKDRRDEVYQKLWQAMSDKSAPWDAIALQQFLEQSPTLATFESMASANGWRTGYWSSAPSPYIPLDCTYDDLLKRLSHNMRQNLRKRHGKLADIGPVHLESITAPHEVMAALTDGLRIEAAAWKGTAGTAISSDPTVEKFYTRLAQRSAEMGWLKLVFLRVGEKRIAFNYVLDVDGVFYGLKIGYDPEYQAYSPGNLLRNLILKEACDKGRREYDFLGIPDQWKLAWTQQTRPHRWLFMFRNRPLPLLLHYTKFTVLPTMRRKGLTKYGFR